MTATGTRSGTCRCVRARGVARGRPAEVRPPSGTGAALGSPFPSATCPHAAVRLVRPRGRVTPSAPRHPAGHGARSSHRPDQAGRRIPALHPGHRGGAHAGARRQQALPGPGAAVTDARSDDEHRGPHGEGGWWWEDGKGVRACDDARRTETTGAPPPPPPGCLLAAARRAPRLPSLRPSRPQLPSFPRARRW